jgi:tRNA (guanine37-N1)-methyltransferase
LLIEVVTLFPEMIRESLLHGIVGRAQRRELLQVNTEDPRRHTADVHHTVDDRPYGGGPGMVMKPEPLSAAIAAARARLPADALVVALSAQGERLTQERVRTLAKRSALLLVAGRYEGMDERVLESEVDLELSIGDYVLSGGELPALVLIDALARLLPGALGDERSAEQDSFNAGLLDWPHYTRPEEYAGRRVPAVLLSGDHAAIERWRRKQALGRTWLRRRELLDGVELDAECAALLQEFLQEQEIKS